MKKTLFFLALVFFLGACQNKNNKSANTEGTKEEISASFSTINDLLKDAENNLKKTIKLTGVVTHTCKHSGKRCFLADADGEETIRIEASGKINGFNRELVGSTITVTGVLKERRLTKEYIYQWEESVKEKAVEEDGTVETCEAENNNIQKMRNWMKEHGKNYYSIFFIEGINYDIIK